MRISGIRLLGFKSFADKTELLLDPGITAIVGPNGCGKSNVIDAVKWVLGEQRPSSLRAKEMMDVIFSGAGSRRALGMSEVSLVLDNSDGRIPLEQTEVMLTRRLYRSGESDYLINGRSCRLRDLREALMDTGSGLDAFSIMEQGKIDRILTANPVERRTVFEEAAGIGKYKARRKETLRRLERIGDDLTRLRDVVEITEKQLRSLRYQASRANRYRNLTEDLKKKRVTWALYRYHAFLTERARITAELDAAAEKESRAGDELGALLTGLSGEESSFETLGGKVQGAEAELLTLAAEIRSCREGAEHARRLSAELADRIQWYESETRVTERRLEEIREERGAMADELAALSAEAALRETELTQAESQIEDARDEEAARELELAMLRQRRVSHMEKKSTLRNERVALETEMRRGAGTGSRLDGRLAAVGEERGRLLLDADEQDARLTERQTAEQETREKLARVEEESAEVESRLATLSEQAAASDRTLSGARSRLELLTSMRARHEGTDQAVQKVLVEAAREGTALPGVVGIVADVLEVVGPDVEAVELALGACSQGIVTETLDDALRAIAWLKEKRLGRALFIPLTDVREAGPTYGGNGIARSALESVDADERFLPLVRALLSDSILVEDVDKAREMADDVGRLLRIVTGGGEVLNRIGTITGGLGRSPRALLTRNAEIEKLTRDVGQEEERSAALAEALETTRASIRDFRSELRALREELEIAARETREAEAAADRTRRDLARLDEEEQVLRKEVQELDREREEHGARDGELALQEEELNLEEEELRAQSESLEDAFRVAREGVKTAVEQQTEVRVALARSRERLAGAESRIQALARGEDEAERNLELFHTEKESTSRRRDQVLVDADVATRDAEEGEQRREKMIKDVAGLLKRHGEAREKLLERRREADELREEHDKYRGTLEEFRLKESENRLKVEGLLERVQDEFDLDLDDLYQGFTPEEVDWEALDQEVTDLRQKIDRMGNVNLEALDQLTEVEERVKFLKEQEADLLKSRETLLDILRKVNRESRERFEKAFSEIRQHFREMYRKLFGGGNAEIILEEGQDVLEAGIEIVVRPPGRELQSLNLLSGGEKTLTAVALLFAIFKARPSPFALLDEVDAALDESNIDRFLAVLRDFTAQSQFVIITHNKRTMADADALYGVSMPEVGVSKPVSMRFSRHEEPAAAEPAAEPIATGD